MVDVAVGKVKVLSSFELYPYIQSVAVILELVYMLTTSNIIFLFLFLAVLVLKFYCNRTDRRRLAEF